MCVYCENGEEFKDASHLGYMGTDCWIDKDGELVIENTEKDTIDYFKIKYCPYCGKEVNSD